jgi:hypothetical protein
MRVTKLLLAILTLCCAGVAKAQYTYTYTGTPYVAFAGDYSAANFVSGSFTVESALADGMHDFFSSPPLQMSFNDGLGVVSHTFSSAVGSVSYVTVADSSIIGWDLRFMSPDPSVPDQAFYLATTPSVSAVGIFSLIDLNVSSAAYSNGSGSWTVSSVTTPIPEPEIYAMMLAGLGVLGFVARRKKKLGVSDRGDSRGKAVV